MKQKDLSLNLFDALPITEIIFERKKPLIVRTHGNGFHYILRGEKIFICQSDNFTKCYDPEKEDYVEKLIAPYRIAYKFRSRDVVLRDFAKETWREEAMQIIQAAIVAGKDEVTIPNFFEREWLAERRKAMLN